MASEKPSNKKKAVVIALAAILAVLVLCAAAVWLLFKNYMGKINFEHSTSGQVQSENSLSDDEILEELMKEEEATDASDSPEEEIAKLESQIQENKKDPESSDSLLSKDEVFNVMLIGCDSRTKGGVGRSDAMILVSVNEETKKIHLTSIMRDCYVAIPGKENNRINAAYAFGGGSLLLDTVETNFAVEVDKYIAFDFYSFIDIVDTLGGIEIDVSDEELPVLNGYIMDLNAINGRDIGESLLPESGLQHLNGIQALCYSRIRHIGNGDFERTERQREVLSMVFDKVKDMNLLQLNDLLNIFLPEIKTNLTEDEILTLLIDVMNYLTYELDSMRIPVEGSYESLRVNKMAVLGIDLEKNQKALEDFIYN